MAISGTDLFEVYLPFLYKVYFLSEKIPTIWPCIAQYLHFRALKFALTWCFRTSWWSIWTYLNVMLLKRVIFKIHLGRRCFFLYYPDPRNHSTICLEVLKQSHGKTYHCKSHISLGDWKMPLRRESSTQRNAQTDFVRHLYTVNTPQILSALTGVNEPTHFNSYWDFCQWKFIPGLWKWGKIYGKIKRD